MIQNKYSIYEEVNIREPLYDNFVYIRDVILYRAIKKHKLLRIKIPQGIGIHDPRSWLKAGKRMEKVFLRPDEPMILYGNRVKIEKPKDKDKELEKLSKESLT